MFVVQHYGSFNNWLHRTSLRSIFNGKHTYIIAAYAMNKNIGKKLGAITRKSFEKKYKNIIIQKSELSGFWP